MSLKFGFEKRGIFNKIPFLHKAFHGDFWKRLHFDIQPNSCYESDYECICIMINGKTYSVPLNILSSVFG